jgi:hypothetical protein
MPQRNGNDLSRSMDKLKENTGGYAHPTQREVLLGLLDNETIRDRLFLTGGTALSVFYLNHRASVDLDLFAVEKIPQDDIFLWISRTWPKECEKINQNQYILQTLIKNIKVDIVYDPISFDEPREKYYFTKDKFIKIDTIRNMGSNKLCTLVGRREIKDFVDFYFLFKKIKNADFDAFYEDAQRKEGMFDDSPTVAYQLECNLAFIKENPDIFPETIVNFDRRDFYVFYENLVHRIYHRKT